METEKVSVKHSFSDDERLSLGEKQSELLGKQDELEAQLKSAKTQIQAQIDSCEATIRAVSSKLRSRYEFREIDCMIMDHRIPGSRVVMRMDSGHVVKQRKLRQDEMQVKLTSEPAKEFIAIALCPVDDRAVDADFLELHVFEDEFDILRKCPDVTLRDVPKLLKGDGKKK